MQHAIAMYDLTEYNATYATLQLATAITLWGRCRNLVTKNEAFWHQKCVSVDARRRGWLRDSHPTRLLVSRGSVSVSRDRALTPTGKGTCLGERACLASINCPFIGRPDRRHLSVTHWVQKALTRQIIFIWSAALFSRSLLNGLLIGWELISARVTEQTTLL